MHEALIEHILYLLYNGIFHGLDSDRVVMVRRELDQLLREIDKDKSDADPT